MYSLMWEKDGFSCDWLELFYIFVSLTTQWSLSVKNMKWMFFFSFPFAQDPSCTWTRKEVQWKACSYCCSGMCAVIPWAVVLTLHSWYIDCTFGHRVTLADVIIYLCFMYNKITTQNVRFKISDNCLFNAFSVFIADLLQKWFVYNGLIQVKGNSKNIYTVKMPVIVSCHCTPGYSVMKKMSPQSDLVMMFDTEIFWDFCPG